MANIKPKIVFEMLFLIISNADIDFQARNLQWRSYITGNVFLTTKRGELIGKKEFAATIFDLEHEIFIIHVAALSRNPGDEMHPSKRAQIAYLKADEVSIKVPSKYADFADVFSLKLVAELPKHTGINDHAIELMDD